MADLFSWGFEFYLKKQTHLTAHNYFLLATNAMNFLMSVPALHVQTD